MFAAITVFHVISSIALILIVLLQAGKGVGIANVFGGAGQTVFGARTGDVLARGTEVCAGIFILTSLLLAHMSSERTGSVMRRVAMPQEQPVPPSADQQAAMVKMKEALAGIVQAAKQASTAQQTAPSTSTAPATTAAQPAAAPAPTQPATNTAPAQPAPEPIAQPAASSASVATSAPATQPASQPAVTSSSTSSDQSKPAP